MTQTSGWFPDPYGRFRRRSHDGTWWTEHEANDGAPQLDPLGSSPIVPFVQPQSTLPGVTTMRGRRAGPLPTGRTPLPPPAQ